jgi:hypothetical protein
MKKTDLLVPRREFIMAFTGILLGNSLVGWSQDSVPGSSLVQKAREQLSADELKWIESSALAKDLKNYFGNGYSCAESVLMVSLRYLGKPEELVWAAAGFGGGLYHRDLCGFLTGGIMALGFACGMLDRPKKEAKEFCGDSVRKYWKWWGTKAPYRCSQLRSEGATSLVCLNQGLLASAKIEELIGPIKKERG